MHLDCAADVVIVAICRHFISYIRSLHGPLYPFMHPVWANTKEDKAPLTFWWH